MANKSILAAFERMWQHTVAAIDNINAFTVLITYDADTDTYSADKTFAEVIAAIRQGFDARALWHRNETDTLVYKLVSYSDTSVFFQFDFMSESATYIRMNSDNTITFHEFDYDDPTAIPNATNVSVVSADGSITVTATYDNGSESVSVIALDENDYPVSVTTNGVECNVSWEGFSV